MAKSAAGPTKQEIEAVFARLRSQAANKVNQTSFEQMVLDILIYFA